MKIILLTMIKGYQRLLSPMLPPMCRYAPSCSVYMTEAIHTHGALRGFGLGLRRILRCHPLSRHDHYDPVPVDMDTDKTL